MQAKIFDRSHAQKAHMAYAGPFFEVIGTNSIGIYMAAHFFAYPVFAKANQLAQSEKILPILLVLSCCLRRKWYLKV